MIRKILRRFVPAPVVLSERELADAELEAAAARLAEVRERSYALA